MNSGAMPNPLKRVANATRFSAFPISAVEFIQRPSTAFNNGTLNGIFNSLLIPLHTRDKHILQRRRDDVHRVDVDPAPLQALPNRRF